MNKSIIQRCPICGCWCKATSNNALDRMINQVIDHTEALGNRGEKYLGKFGKFAGIIVGTHTGMHEGVFNALVGDRYQFTCPQCHSTWSTNTDEGDKTDSYKLDKEAYDNIEKIRAALDLKNQHEIQEYTSLIQNELADENCDDYTKATLHTTLAFAFLEQDERTKALEHINRSLILIDGSNSRALKGCIMDEGRSSVDAYAAMKEIIYYKKSEEDSLYLTKESFSQRFRTIQSSYVNRFLAIPQQQRRFVYLVPGDLDDKLDQLPEDLYVLPIGYLPTEMDFVGAPKEQTLYVCHPYKSNLYIPYERYDVELFRDELEEFCWIMDCLGAERIKFSDGKSKTQSNKSKNGIEFHGGGQYKGIGGQTTVSSDSQTELDAQTKELLEKGKSFDRSSTHRPYIPNDTVWYQHNNEWQRNCTSRLEGRLREYSFTISKASSECITKATRKKLDVEIDAIVVGLSGGIEKSEKNTNQNEDTHVISSHVKFYPMSEYQDKSTTKSNKWLFWVVGGVIAALAIGLIIVLKAEFKLQMQLF